MLTSKALLNTAQELAPDESTTLLQRWLIHGNNTLNAAFNRYWNRLEKTTNLIADQRYYQLPEDAIRVISVSIVKSDGTVYVLKPIVNEDDWNMLTSGQNDSYAYPLYYFQRGSDEIGIFPKPNETVENAVHVSYMPRTAEWRFEEYTTGTVTVNNGSITVAIAGGSFLQQQIGMSFKVNDGTHDLWQKIGEFTDSSTIGLENYYAGISGAGRSYIIGEIPIIPEEFHDNIVDYAMYRHSQKKGNANDARDYQALFADAITRMQREYSTPTTNQVIHTGRNTRTRGYDPFTNIPNTAHY